MHIALISKNLSPVACGIGDHSALLAAAIRSAGHKVTLVGGNGADGDDRRIWKDFWRKDRQDGLLRILRDLEVDHVMLQFTPMTFVLNERYADFGIADLWAECFARWSTSLILHESYFRAWWHPPSLLKGTLEKRLLKRLVRTSGRVFTASQPLCGELEGWRSHAKICLLPIGSNLPVADVDRDRKRTELGIEPADVILTLFGAGGSLRRLRRYVDNVDRTLLRQGVAARWLLLGQVRAEWFSLALPVITSGFLPPEELSALFQVTDIFLMPHVWGLSAKRGTLMAALQHGLPVVGTTGKMTDDFWRDAPGVTLIETPGARDFAAAVLGLSRSPARRHAMGQMNRDYFGRHFTWDRVASRLLQCVG